jgi:hypothetical protein
MAAAGWAFNWSDASVFLPAGDYCSGVPASSYCGFNAAGGGSLSIVLAGAGTVTVAFGNNGQNGTVSLLLDDSEVASAPTGQTDASVSVDFTHGSVLTLAEDDAVLFLHGLHLDYQGFAGRTLTSTRTRVHLHI